MGVQVQTRLLHTRGEGRERTGAARGCAARDPLGDTPQVPARAAATRTVLEHIETCAHTNPDTLLLLTRLRVARGETRVIEEDSDDLSAIHEHRKM